jgi:hypothetical protein
VGNILATSGGTRTTIHFYLIRLIHTTVFRPFFPFVHDIDPFRIKKVITKKMAIG